LDLPHHQSVDWLELGHIITGDELEACRASQGVEISSGDIVLIRTGFLDFFFALETGTPMPFEQAGIGVDAAKWLAARDVGAACVPRTRVKRSASRSRYAENDRSPALSLKLSFIAATVSGAKFAARSAAARARTMRSTSSKTLATSPIRSAVAASKRSDSK